jgi:beta-aspartyl-peptidase (threonine type)
MRERCATLRTVAASTIISVSHSSLWVSRTGCHVASRMAGANQVSIYHLPIPADSLCSEERFYGCPARSTGRAITRRGSASMPTPQLIVHGGVVETLSKDFRAELETLRAVCAAGREKLLDGQDAMSVCIDTVHELEVSGKFLAGRGACPNTNGVFELDASIMNGWDRSAAGVAAVPNVAGAVRIAKSVMDNSAHVLVVGSEARNLPVPPELLVDEGYYRPIFSKFELENSKPLGFGTVGAAAMDLKGRFSAATATGGVTNKMPGRVGDTPIPGAGTWADDNVAVSCTGQGEYFIRHCSASVVGRRVEWLGDDPRIAARNAICEIGARGGLGGLIVAHAGGVCWEFNTAGMKRAWIDSSGECLSAVAET